MAVWDAEQYLKFEKQRTQPSIDLAARIPRDAPAAVLDVGCGPGNSTKVLKERFPSADILGIDNSAEMVYAAKKNYPELKFMQCDAAVELHRLGRKFDVIFSNACLQWIPDHPVLLKTMMEYLNEGGVLAVQIPVNQEEPIHRIITAAAESDEWRHKFSTPRIFHQLPAGVYHDLLAQLSSDFELWQTTYFHRMQSHGAIMEWYRGTGLRPYLQVLSAEEQAVFERGVYDALVAEYPVQENGEIIFRFPRLFFLAEK